MRKYHIEGHVVLRALVNEQGRVDSTSILAVETTDGAFTTAAYHALAHALFRPGRFGGHPGVAWITIGVDFTFGAGVTP